MVHGTFATNFVRENYRNMCHLWRLDGTRTWIYGLMGAFVVMRVASSTGPSENQESRIAASKHYRLNMSEKMDHPVYRLPPVECNTKGHKPEAKHPH